MSYCRQAPTDIVGIFLAYIRAKKRKLEADLLLMDLTEISIK